MRFLILNSDEAEAVRGVYGDNKGLDPILHINNDETEEYWLTPEVLDEPAFEPVLDILLACPIVDKILLTEEA